jgi:pimeloyl-ACP methyl ester carboxylesterase/DNA-binding SARP family transcriptional activator
MVSIQLLGELTVRDGEDVRALPRSRKTRVLLGYLAATARPQRRERLCELLWELPDDPRGALRWSLSKLRGLLDREGAPAIVADRQSAALNLESVEVDLLSVRIALKDGVEAASTATLREVAPRFRGPFLADLDAGLGAELQSWVAGVREETRRLQSAVLVALDDRFAPESEDGLPFAHELIHVDPTWEEAWARLVARLVALGRRQEAEAQYAAAIQSLREVGGVTHVLERALRPAPAQAAVPTTAADEGGTEEPRQEIRFCAAPGGVRIAYALSGQGPPLVKAANWMNHLEYDWESPIWGHLLRGLSRQHTLLRYDARGNGLSDWDVDELSQDAWVSDLAAVVDSAGFDRFPLLGVSQGCAISIDYAVRRPERVSHLILYAGAPAGANKRTGNPEEREERAALKTLMKIGWGQSNPAFRQIFTSTFAPGATKAQADAFNELQRRTTSPESAVRYFDATANLDVRHLLARVTQPTLVMHPRGDMDTPIELGRQLAAGIPGAQFIPLPGQNHLFLQGEPAEARFFDELRRFLAS